MSSSSSSSLSVSFVVERLPRRRLPRRRSSAAAILLPMLSAARGDSRYPSAGWSTRRRSIARKCFSVSGKPPSFPLRSNVPKIPPVFVPVWRPCPRHCSAFRDFRRTTTTPTHFGPAHCGIAGSIYRIVCGRHILKNGFVGHSSSDDRSP